MAEAGQTVGNWRLVRPLGSGATAGVWLGHREDDASDIVAVKIIRPHSFENARARYERETKILRTLNHPNIVGFRDSGDLDAERAFFLVMDMVEGEELVATIRRGPLPPDRARALFRGLAEGLDHAHQRGIFHRDLKPENVMVRPDGSGCLIDFGIAFEEGGANLTREGMLPGTVGYFPPEVFERGARPDPRLGDIYALGLMLFETLEGRSAYPLDADLSTNQQVLRILADKMDRREITPAVALPQDLADTLRDATHPDPARRIQTAAELVDRLGGRKVSPLRASAAGATMWVEADDEPAMPPAAPPAPAPSMSPPAHPVAVAEEPFGPGAGAPVPVPPVITKVVRPAPAPVAPAASMPTAPPAASPPTASTPGWVRVALGASAALVLLSVVVVFFVLRLSAAPAAPAAATLNVVPMGELARVRVDGVDAVAGADGWTASGLSAGEHHLTVAAGSGCGTDGEVTCGGCCACTAMAVTLAAGQIHKMDVVAPELPSSRPVQVTLAGDLAGRAARVQVGEVDALADGAAFTASAPLAPGVPVRVDVGSCPDDASGCAAASTCPEGCWSSVTPVDLVCGTGAQGVSVTVPAPTAPPEQAAAPVARPVKPARAPRPVPTTPAPASAQQILSVSARVDSSSGVDPGKLATAVRAMAPSVQYCWRQLPPPYVSLSAATVDFKIKRDGTVDPASPVLAARSGNPAIDQCVLTKVKAALFGADAGAGKARVTISFTVK